MPRGELIEIVHAVAREKLIEREDVFEAVEQAIARAARVKYGLNRDIRAKLDRQTGEVEIASYREVCTEVEDSMRQISLEEVGSLHQSLDIGSFYVEPLPPIEIGRVAAQSAKQVILQRVRESERRRQYAEYKDRAGEIVNGVVKRNEYGNVTVDLGRAEGLLRRNQCLPREALRVGDRVRSYIYEVREEPRGAQIFLSRTHPEFMRKLFVQEVPEVYDGVIEIKSVARDPGSRAKISVSSNDQTVDPVGACVGMRGSRVQAVVGELLGEKIDIIPWTQDIATFTVNALAPAEVSKVVYEEEKKFMEIIVPEEQLSLAIGRRGQNVRLASMLTGLRLEIITDKEEAKRRREEIERLSEMFMESLEVDDVIAHLLAVEGFGSVPQVAYVPLSELERIEGFDEKIAKELQSRAQTFLEKRAKEDQKRCKELGVSDELYALEEVTPAIAVRLGENNITTVDNLGDLSADELLELLGDLAPERVHAETLIMDARKGWFLPEKAHRKDETS